MLLRSQSVLFLLVVVTAIRSIIYLVPLLFVTSWGCWRGLGVFVLESFRGLKVKSKKLASNNSLLRIGEKPITLKRTSKTCRDSSSSGGRRRERCVLEEKLTYCQNLSLRGRGWSLSSSWLEGSGRSRLSSWNRNRNLSNLSNLSR
jgi:hypothetical protein